MKQDILSDPAWLDVSGEISPPAPSEAQGECCGLCAWPAARLFAYRPDLPLCASCWLCFHLDSPTATRGALSWLPGLKPADVVNLQRLAFIAITAGSADQQKEGRRVLRWMMKHKREVENYWKTSRPSEFAAALSRLAPSERLGLREQLRGTHLIMPAAAFSDLTLLLATGADPQTLLSQCALMQTGSPLL